jgi:hypothetical protein
VAITVAGFLSQIRDRGTCGRLEVTIGHRPDHEDPFEKGATVAELQFETIYL